MGIPDTFTMPIYDSQIFTATAEETSSNGGTTESMPQCTQVFWTVLLNFKKDKKEPSPSESFNGDSSKCFSDCEDIIKATNIKKFTPTEIQKATGNYSKKNIIGRGGSGIVFKGILPNNQVIAVKRHSQEMSHQGKDEFVNEINILSQLNNKNVVKLLGCCFERKLPSIVYEYIPNGTLYDHLFDAKNPCVLTWNHRLRIATQVAEVLAFLHTTIRVPIVHRDIKSMNILLDAKYMAKVSDFGVSKFGPCLDWEDARDLDWEESWVVGTYAYLDPKYMINGRLSTKSDVYSFGVVFAELLTRKKAGHAEWKADGKDLAYKFREMLKDDRVVEILDEQLVNEGSMEHLMKLARLAGMCLELEPVGRPTMSQVVREL